MSVIKRAVLSVLGNRLLQTAHIASVETLSENFRLIEIEEEIPRSLPLQPGQKIQIHIGDWQLRTYTPLAVNAETGRLKVLTFLHGAGPGSEWASRTRSGDTCQFLGPQASLRFSALENPFVLFGDETTIAVAKTLKDHLGGWQPSKLIFEATSVKEVTEVVQKIGLSNATVVAKSADGVIPEESFRALQTFATGETEVLLAGRAQSILQMRERLKNEGFRASRITAKAYWSEGKRGLD